MRILAMSVPRTEAAQQEGPMSSLLSHCCFSLLNCLFSALLEITVTACLCPLYIPEASTLLQVLLVTQKSVLDKRISGIQPELMNIQISKHEESY